MAVKRAELDIIGDDRCCEDQVDEGWLQGGCSCGCCFDLMSTLDWMLYLE
jgi:hypothetical protein